MVKEPTKVVTGGKPTLAVAVPIEGVKRPEEPIFEEVMVYRPPSQQSCQFPAPKPGEPVRQEEFMSGPGPVVDLQMTRVKVRK